MRPVDDPPVIVQRCRSHRRLSYRHDLLHPLGDLLGHVLEKAREFIPRLLRLAVHRARAPAAARSGALSLDSTRDAMERSVSNTPVPLTAAALKDGTSRNLSR